MKIQPLFYTSSPDRSAEFALETRIWNDNGTVFAEKRPLTPSSQKHLDRMLETYKKLSSIGGFNNKVNISKATKKDGGVRFEYIEGDSGERKLIDAILQNDRKEVKKIIDILVGVIETLPSVKLNPVENQNYKRIFGNSFDATADCAEIGLIDLNLDNFIIDKKENWHLIDYEWVFDFPVSKYFLIQRCLWWFIVRYQETFRFHSEKLKNIAIADNLFVPEVIHNSYSTYLANLEELQVAESSFQSYVKGSKSNSKPFIEFYSEPKIITKHPVVGLDRILMHEQRAAKMQIQIVKLEERNASLKKENHDILQSNTYRISRKISTAKRRLLGD